MNLKLAEYPIKRKTWVHTCIDETTMRAVNAKAKEINMPKMYVINAALGQVLLGGAMKKTAKAYGKKTAATKKTTKTSKKK